MDDDIPVSNSPFAKLPDLLKKVIDRDVFAQGDIEIEEQNGLTIEQGDKMMDVIRMVIFKTITPVEVVATIQRVIGLDEVRAKKLALDLLGKQFLPMQWYIGNVEGLITELGGDVAKYQAEAQKNYPEVYAPQPTPETEEPTEKIISPFKDEAAKDEPTILRNIDERLTTNKGRAEVLLRLTALSQQIDEAMKSGKFGETQGQEMLHSLDALSYAINTQDLNPLEIAAIKRRLKNVLSKLAA